MLAILLLARCYQQDPAAAGETRLDIHEIRQILGLVVLSCLFRPSSLLAVARASAGSLFIVERQHQSSVAADTMMIMKVTDSGRANFALALPPRLSTAFCVDAST